MDALPLGPNVACDLGHSDLRVATMGLGPATDGKVRPTAAQMKAMERHLEDALDAGFLGFSSMTSLDACHEAPTPGVDGLMRMVRRNDRAVAATLIGGDVVYEAGRFVDGFGADAGHGRFLPAGERVAARHAVARTAAA